MTDFLSGFALGFSLILAIGAQNAFVLRQGLRGQHVFLVCLTCAISDAILIAAGVAGFGWIAEAFPGFASLMRWGGAAFLIFYGAMSFRSAIRGSESLSPDSTAPVSARRALLTCLALTWLNPHVYLDTLVLIGAVAAQYESRSMFGTGAVLSSAVFFFSLGFGARALAPMFRDPRAWRIMDALVGVLMWSIAAGLLFYR